MRIKILGINWNPRTDYFDFSASPIEQNSSFTKKETFLQAQL